MRLVRRDLTEAEAADYARIGATGAWVWYGNTFTQTFYSYGGSNFGQPSNDKTIVGDFNGDTRTDYARLGDNIAIRPVESTVVATGIATRVR